MTPKQLRKMIQQEMETEAEGIRIYDLLLTFLQDNDGKTITKHLENALRKAHPTLNARLDTRFGMWYFETKTDWERSYLISYDGIVDAGMFPDWACCYGSGARKRNEQRAEFLRNPVAARDLCKLTRAYVKARDALNAWHKENYYTFPDTSAVGICTSGDRHDIGKLGYERDEA